MQPIPAVWRIDIEPDDFQPGSESAAWDGFVTMFELVERLRGRLGDRSGVPIRPTWFIRLDPDIERCFGRTDFIVHRNRTQIDRLLAHGDLVGIHTHFYRWDEQGHHSYTDVADDAWNIECLDVSASTFKQCFGESVRRASQGGYFMSDRLVERSIALGIEVDVTVEPGLAAKKADPSFGDYATAPSPSFEGFPRHPYYPSRTALGMAARSEDDARRLLIVPLTSYDYKTALLPWRKRISKRLRGESAPPRPLNPWKAWPHPLPTGISSLGRSTKARPATSRLRFAPTDRVPRAIAGSGPCSNIFRSTPSRRGCASSIRCRRKSADSRTKR